MQEFQGFDFSVGQKKFRYKVSNPKQVGETQTDISKFIINIQMTKEL